MGFLLLVFVYLFNAFCLASVERHSIITAITAVRKAVRGLRFSLDKTTPNVKRNHYNFF